MKRAWLLTLLCSIQPAIAVETVNKVGLSMVNIPAGSIAMGTCKPPSNTTCLVGKPDIDAFNHEAPQHRVSLSAFQISKMEVTVKQFTQFIAAKKRQTLLSDRFKLHNRHGDEKPVVMVSWQDAQDFIAWLNQIEPSGGYRLPSEAEWEYACRTEKHHTYCGGSNAPYLAWYNGNSDNHPHSVGKKMPNDFGLHDMSGNALEWVEDCWHDSYAGAPSNGQSWTTRCDREDRVQRGGSWYDQAEHSLATYRTFDHPATRVEYVGFRVARTLPAKK